MLKKWRIRNARWPLQIMLKSVKVSQVTYPDTEVEVLVGPRKRVFLGECKIEFLPSGLKSDPRTPVESHDFQEWRIGERIDSPRTYRLSFYGAGKQEDTIVRLQIESEGYICKSNQMRLPKEIETPCPPKLRQDWRTKWKER